MCILAVVASAARVCVRSSFTMHDFAWPFTTLIIADLMVVPEEARQLFREKANLGNSPL